MSNACLLGLIVALRDATVSEAPPQSQASDPQKSDNTATPCTMIYI